MINLIPWTRGDAGSLLDLRSEMDRVFDRFFDSPMMGSQRAGGGQMMQLWSPAMEMYEEGDNLVVCAEVPGMEPDDIDINVTGNMLTISGEKREESEDKKEGFYRSERRYGQFHRIVELPDDIDPDNVKAEYENGVLTLRIPKPRQEERQPKRIPVSAGQGRKKTISGQASEKGEGGSPHGRQNGPQGHSSSRQEERSRSGGREGASSGKSK
jgi:HSP20 family protein